MGIIARDALNIRGAVAISLRDVYTGNTETHHACNLVTDVGLNVILNRLVTASPSPMGYMAIGSGTGSFPGSETAMYNEVTRKALTTVSVANNVGTWRAYFSTAEAICTVREIGLANAAGSGAGILISHVQVSPPMIKTNTREMTVSIQHTLTRT